MAHCNKCNDGINEDTGLRCEYCDGFGNVPDEPDYDDYEQEDEDGGLFKCEICGRELDTDSDCYCSQCGGKDDF